MVDAHCSRGEELKFDVGHLILASVGYSSPRCLEYLIEQELIPSVNEHQQRLLFTAVRSPETVDVLTGRLGFNINARESNTGLTALGHLLFEQEHNETAYPGREVRQQRIDFLRAKGATE